MWLGVHDSSRIEWTASVPLPRSGDLKYEIEFSFEIPSNIYCTHNVWDHKQSFTRLQSPTEEGELSIDRADLDELRRDTLGVAHRLKRQRDAFGRACIGAAAQLTEALHPQLEQKLMDAVEQAVSVVAEMRRCLEAPVSADAVPPDVSREWRLADEFLSHQLLDFLGASQRSLDDVLLGVSSRMLELDCSFTDRVRERLAEGLKDELEHRQARGFVSPRADSPRALAEFVGRASQLKKHFQDVLFLDVEAYMVDFRLRNYTAVVAASLAAAFWLAFTLIPIGPGTRFGVSVGTFTVMFAIAYALKDRIKETLRAWLAGRLVRLYGQRVVKLRLPGRLHAARPVLIEARETFDCEAQTRDDHLNRAAGRTVRVMILRYKVRGEAHAQRSLEEAGIASCKHIFRYDLSPIFSRLDNAVKQVPILDEVSRRVRFVEAPKEYRLAVRLQANVLGHETVEHALLVVSKRGIERVEPVAAENA
ncbi:MAG TPA: hypothetical protein VFF06_29650 [Polyangia bacterium]|nr:hypothetical protein [Polyangia bacterium]